MGRAELAEIVASVLEPFALRFTLSRDRTERTREALLAIHRMEAGSWKPAARVQFANRSGFEDALALTEIKVEASGRGGEELELWQQAGRQRSPAPPRRKRRRGRRRRRRGPAQK